MYLKILKSVHQNSYRGLVISEDTYINNICSKESSTLGFLRRNLLDTVPETVGKMLTYHMYVQHLQPLPQERYR